MAGFGIALIVDSSPRGSPPHALSMGGPNQRRVTRGGGRGPVTAQLRCPVAVAAASKEIERRQLRHRRLTSVVRGGAARLRELRRTDHSPPPFVCCSATHDRSRALRRDARVRDPGNHPFPTTDTPGRGRLGRAHFDVHRRLRVDIPHNVCVISARVRPTIGSGIGALFHGDRVLDDRLRGHRRQDRRARLTVTAQMVCDLVVVGLVLRLTLCAARGAIDQPEPQAEAASAPSSDARGPLS